MSKSIRMIALGVILIGVVVGVTGGFVCANWGLKGGTFADLIIGIGVCAIGGLLCFVGGWISALRKD